MPEQCVVPALRSRLATRMAWAISGLLVCGCMAQGVIAQTAAPASAAQQLQDLQRAVSRSEAQLAATQQEVRELRRALDALQQQMVPTGGSTPPGRVSGSSGAGPTDAASAPSGSAQQESSSILDELRERQGINQAEIAVHEQTKVETESRYPLKLTGLVLFNGFVNSGRVDLPATPTVALSGSGSAGASIAQTVLGLEARGPRLLGAHSTADLYADFYGASASGSGYGGLRLRTAHASLLWPRAEVFFDLDRPILNPGSPTSLTAVALPPLAWSGNLWSWNPQLGLRLDVSHRSASAIRVEAALIDSADPYSGSSPSTPGPPNPNAAERSSRPGAEAHVSWLHGASSRLASARSGWAQGTALGVGGYFSPHRSPSGASYDAWAATVDLRTSLPWHMQWSGSAFRGAALGGLGAGAFKDYVVRRDARGTRIAALDDVGGWTQLKQQLTDRLEWNAAYGIDNVFAGQIRQSSAPYNGFYADLVRNRTAVGNVIYAPSAALNFSFEYRFLQSSRLNTPTGIAHVYGAAAAYKF